MSSLNNSSNVTAAKPNITGAIYRAPLSTSLPTTADESLNVAFKCLGYLNEDGITNSNTRESDAFKAWGGDTVLTSQTNYSSLSRLQLIFPLHQTLISKPSRKVEELWAYLTTLKRKRMPRH